VPASPGALTPETPQARAVHHRGGPLLVLGGAGSGRTQALVDRFATLVAEGVAPEEILLLTRGAAAAEALRARVEDALGDRPFEELPVLPIHGMCARLLRDEALEAGIDPFAVTATPADRLALLLDHVEELRLRRHDLRGRPAAVLGAIVARIDRLKEAGIRPRRFSEWAASLPEHGSERAEREREFAGLFEAHDRLLLEQGLLDFGEVVLRVCELLEQRPHVRARVAGRWRHVLVDDLEDATPAQLKVITLLAADHGELIATADDDQAIDEPRGAAARLRGLLGARIGGRPVEVVVLGRSLRCPERVVTAAEAVVAPIADRLEEGWSGTDVVGTGIEGDVRLWRCASERAQAQGVAAAIERLVREGVAPGRIGVLVRSVRSEGQELAVALEERALPFRLAGAAAFFGQAEVRDVLAWLRLLVNPNDAAAVVRALARPPIELHAVDLARCIQIAKRRKLDMVSGLVAATESPQLPPEARERVLAFLKLHRQAAAALDTTRPDLFVHRLVERLGLRRQQVFAAQADVVERLVSLAHVGELAASYVRRAPQATPREFARWLAAVAEAGGGIGDPEDDDDGAPPREDAVAVLPLHGAKGLEFDHVFVCGLQSSRMPGARRVAVEPIPPGLADAADVGGGDAREEHLAEMRRVLHVAMTRAREGLVLAYSAHSERGAPQHPSPFVEDVRAALGEEWEDLEEELFGPDEALHAAIGQLRDELLRDVQQIGARLGELRLDTDLDVAHGVTRYLELLKLAALHARPEGQAIGDALPGINAAILHAATGQQREILQTSSLDDVLLDGERDASVRAKATAARHEPSLAPFLPRRGEGLALSASDIETYRTCPLKYKFARVFRVPQEPTINQRFGIVVHQVLERYHQSGGRSVDELLGLLEAGWRRSGFGPSDEERQLHGKAESALRRYHERFQADDGEPMWFEKSFNFKIGAHTLRGRVDRVDRRADGRYELIDYKTGRPKAPAQLRDDVQLALYAVAATEAWNLEASVQSYLYVLDDQKVPLPDDANDAEWIAETVLEVADGILGQGFEPTPSYAACSICDYRIACPAAER
jgi:DNA helicase II / ATP-dependent DNA helicase PcrA